MWSGKYWDQATAWPMIDLSIAGHRAIPGGDAPHLRHGCVMLGSGRQRTPAMAAGSTVHDRTGRALLWRQVLPSPWQPRIQEGGGRSSCARVLAGGLERDHGSAWPSPNP